MSVDAKMRMSGVVGTGWAHATVTCASTTKWRLEARSGQVYHTVYAGRAATYGFPTAMNRRVSFCDGNGSL